MNQKISCTSQGTIKMVSVTGKQLGAPTGCWRSQGEDVCPLEEPRFLLEMPSSPRGVFM